MKILINNNDLNEALYSTSNLGFVPTMGCLHRGHISLIKKSLIECHTTIVSIFVNPTQFNDKKDYKKYPRNINKDLSILKRLKVHFVYIPHKKSIYNPKRKSKIKINKIDKILCAKYRKNHFEGVIDVMDRLTRIIKPKKIFMGEKDLQQLYLVKKYLKNRSKANIIACKTIRNKNKLALSSRNYLLNKKDLNKAGKIAKDIITFKKNLLDENNLVKLIKKKKELKKKYNINIQYFELRDRYNLKHTKKIKNSNIFIAYYLNKVRLIDNF
jgi:pantoate--beta-alanine ligase